MIIQQFFSFDYTVLNNQLFVLYFSIGLLYIVINILRCSRKKPSYNLYPVSKEFKIPWMSKCYKKSVLVLVSVILCKITGSLEINLWQWMFSIEVGITVSFQYPFPCVPEKVPFWQQKKPLTDDGINSLFYFKIIIFTFVAFKFYLYICAYSGWL